LCFISSLDFPTICDYTHIDENLVDATNGNIHNGQAGTNYGEVWPVDGDGSRCYTVANNHCTSSVYFVF